MNDKIFREYDIRGKAEEDLPNSFVLNLGKSIGTFLQRKETKKIALGRDCRLSSERIHGQLLEGLLSTGLDIIDVGLVPTPLLYFSVHQLDRDGGIMITGSHNPGEYNGFKITGKNLPFFGEDIQSIRKIVQSKDFTSGKGTHREQTIQSDYISYMKANLRHPLPLKIVVDSGNGMAGAIAPELYEALGCDVVSLYSELDGHFPNHHPDPTVIENLTALKAKIQETGAQLGIGFDGDADRIGVVDATGKVIFGDELLLLYARQILQDNPGAKIISEVKASHRLFKDIKAHGGYPIMWKTGHSLIKSKMKEIGALAAGEMSGHMFFKDRHFGFDDAIYAGARLLEIVHETGKTPSELLSDVPESFNTPEIRVDCADESKFNVVNSAKLAFQKKGWEVVDIDGARVEFDDGWGLVRASNTQPVLVYRFEATSEARLQEIRSEIETIVSQYLGGITK